ncbi:MAG: hypothetical protein K2X66_17080 [Cyanobacteria bacterium]|nr:hypothetical protein [Cyanobacteriota bacterium]
MAFRLGSTTEQTYTNAPQHLLQETQRNHPSKTWALSPPIQFQGALSQSEKLERHATSLLEVTPRQQAFFQELKTMMAPYGVKQVQTWYEAKRPPIEFLR